MTGDGGFSEVAEPFRRELIIHCYRMLGSTQDAEDVVQETFLRAWRSYDRFEDRSSVRTWLYQIATNRCLTELGKRSRRVLPSGLGPAERDPHAALEPAASSTRWLEPIPDALVIGDWTHSCDPAAVVMGRYGIRLALIASWQHLPPRQRAVLLLRDVLAFSAAEVATMLGTSTASVKSALQRARAQLQELALADGTISEPEEPRARALLDEYIAAFENSDIKALERLLLEDVTLEATPLRTWFTGRRTCIPFLRDQLLGPPRTWRLVAAAANAQPAATVYRRDADGSYQPYGVCVLTMTEEGIARITSFGDSGLLAVFGSEPDRSSGLMTSAAEGRRRSDSFAGSTGSISM